MLKLRIKTFYMSEIKIPTCGRVVHFYNCGNDPICGANSAVFIPAFVVQAWGHLIVNLSCFPMSVDATNVLRYSVHHKSQAFKANEDGGMTQIYPTYWDWPATIA